MTHENIQHPDAHQFGDTLRHQLVMARHELAYLQSKYDAVCDDLRSIITRVEKGDPVYIVMPDGSHLHLVKAGTRRTGQQEGGE